MSVLRSCDRPDQLKKLGIDDVERAVAKLRVICIRVHIFSKSRVSYEQHTICYLFAALVSDQLLGTLSYKYVPTTGAW